MAWQHVESASLAENTLDFYRADDGAFMIRVNGLELMSSRCHVSEDIIGSLAVTHAITEVPRILIGGLGLGHTLDAVLRSLEGRTAMVRVAEISPEIIRWYRETILQSRRQTPDTRAEIVLADVGTMIAAPGESYDSIVLDVDNGPEAFSARSNHALYSGAGLSRLWDATASGGTVLLWSGFVSDTFEQAARAQGFAVACEAVPITQREGIEHYIYILTKTAG